MPGLDAFFTAGEPGNPGLAYEFPLFTTAPKAPASRFAKVYGLASGRLYERRSGGIRSFAFEQQANIFTLLNRFKDLQLDDQDGTPVADRVLRNIDGLIRAASTGLVEGRHISKASLEALDTANLNDNQVTFAKMQDITGPCVVGKPSSGSGDPAEISASADDRVLRRTGGALDFGQLTIGMAAANLWTFAKLQQVTGPVVVGKSGSGAGDMAEISAAADDRVLGRTSGSLSFSQLTVGMAPNSLWSYAKIQDVSATSRILGRKTAGAGVIEELTAADVATMIGGGTKVKKTTTETIQTDTTLGVDAVLKFPMEANKKYSFRLVVHYKSDPGADFKFAHSGPASPALVQIQRHAIAPGATVFSVIRIDTAYSAAAVALLDSGGASEGFIEMNGTIHNGANAGDFEFQWAQNTSAIADTSVLAGSSLDWWES